jgi:hypothetical protein
MGYDRGDYAITTLYYVIGHYSRYIKQGYTILENDGKEFYCISAISPDRDIVITVLYNDDAQCQTVTLKLDGFDVQKAVKIVSCDERKWHTTEIDVNSAKVELEPKSITTLRFMR